MKRVLAFALAIAVTGALSSQGAPAVGWGVTSIDPLESKMLERLNEVRARRGLAPLRLSRGLSSAAHQHSKEMAIAGYCGHDSPSGVPFSRRVSRFYDRPAGWRFWSVGENVLCQPRRLSAASAIGQWMGSPGHRANLLSSQWREVGLAAVYADDAPGAFQGRDVWLVTADFGARW